MEKIKVKIENCYGINKLESLFDFTGDKSAYAIYAPNGVMKTSFANVFDDYSKDIQSKDLMYPERKSVREITDFDGNGVEKESIFVIRPYERNFKSEKISTLLAKEELRKRYEEIHKKIDIEKEKLIQELKKVSGVKKDVEAEISEAFMGNRNNFFVALERIEKEVLDDTLSLFSHISYAAIFDEKIISFLETGDFKDKIAKYIEKYDELLNESSYLKKGFNHYNASTVHKNLKDNGFFKAEHTLNLNNKGTKTEILDEKALIKIIEDEKEKIINNTELKKIFDAIDKKITNAQLRDFREYLFDHKDILPELANLHSFKQKLWISYLKNSLDLYKALLQEYKKGQKEITSIVEQAKKETTEWEQVIDIFNRRFFVPFRLGVKNKEDTILKDDAPSIHYFFEDRKENVDEELLYRVLSQGEKRALYLLNIIFEIESRKKQCLKTLYIIDDIADSFDYKNKYAIIEYLKEISECSNFFSIIMSHNFDFFRTIQDRIGMNKWENSYMASKEKDQICLEPLKYRYISNPFHDWKCDLINSVKLIASITFARNIAEYTGDENNCNKLTSVLHIKSDSDKLTIKDLESIYKDIFKDLDSLCLNNHERIVLELIFEIAEGLYNDKTEIGLNLENKIVLSIAIRLNAEKYIISKIKDNAFVSSITSYQTSKLIKRFKKDFSTEIKSVEILEKVNLMTPENIHLNSFMFEPILDISDYHLKKLYGELKQLNASV